MRVAPAPAVRVGAALALVALAFAGPRTRAARADGAAADPDPSAESRAAARDAVGAKEFAKAIPLFFEAIRKTDDYGVKYAIRDEVLALPPVPARALTDREKGTVAARIAEEREKDVSNKARDFEGKGWRHAARILHDRIAKLEGVGRDVATAHRDAIERIDRFLTEEPTDAERAEAKEVYGTGADPAKILAKAGEIAAAGRPRVAIKLYRGIAGATIGDEATREKARQAEAELVRRTVGVAPADQQAAADVVWDDPHWKGLATSASHEFVFIGARDFVTTISDADRIRADLAIVLLGDFVGRNLTSDGERLTIYYKERFDFGGGLGGGKRIDIGNKAISKPIAGGLHWHEMSHCVFDVGIAYPGFTEGIANFGATFCFDALGHPEDTERSIASNRKQFEEDYLQRRMRYWRIQPYGPSCGFLLQPITAGDAEARKAQWAKYREFFKRLRSWGPDEHRDAERIRYFAWHWGTIFGWDLLEKVGLDRFPVLPRDRERVEKEYGGWIQAADRGESYVEQGYCDDETAAPLSKTEQEMPACELRDRLRFALAKCRDLAGDAAGRDALLASLGVLRKWKLCGPFYQRGASALLASFEPERTLDLSAEYRNPVQNAIWKDAKVAWDGRVDFLEHGFAYADDAACYAVCDLKVPAAVPDATFYLGFDDVAALWVNGELVEKWDAAHGWDRDQHVGAASLQAGKNRVVLKVVNVRGDWGFSARVVHGDRLPIEGLEVPDLPAKDVPPSPPESKGTAVLSEDFERTKSVSKSKHRTTVGQWEVDQKCLRMSLPGGVAWQKFLVQPYVKKDAPSALVWLTDKSLATLTDFAVELHVHQPTPGQPKIGVTLHGEEKDDGLSGHTFVVQPADDGVEVRLWEYDRVVYYGRTDAPPSNDHVLRFVRRGRRLSCWVDGKALIDSVDLPPLPHSGIGLMTWNKETGISKWKVERLK
jgi:hypothetical protein